MAYTKKNETTQKEIKKPVDEGKEETVTVNKEEFEQMKAQMQAMMQMMAMAQSPVKVEKKPEKYITFINMTKGKYVLKGNSFYTIEGQFGDRKFIEREARIIVNNMPETVKSGKVYIADADFVKECDLEGVYETLLTDKEMIDLLNHDASYVVEVYKNANKSQREIIVDMIENKRLDGKVVDANILMQIGELSGKDLLNVEPIGKDSKE